jgi:uncharacterized protein YcbX
MIRNENVDLNTAVEAIIAMFQDNWNELFIGDAKFTQFMPCTR